MVRFVIFCCFLCVVMVLFLHWLLFELMHMVLFQLRKKKLLRCADKMYGDACSKRRFFSENSIRRASRRYW